MFCCFICVGNYTFTFFQLPETPFAVYEFNNGSLENISASSVADLAGIKCNNCTRCIY